MKASANKIKYNKEYTEQHYDLMPINFKKGVKDRVKIRCEQLGMNMSEYIRYCVEKEIEKNSNN